MDEIMRCIIQRIAYDAGERPYERISGGWLTVVPYGDGRTAHVAWAEDSEPDPQIAHFKLTIEEL